MGKGFNIAETFGEALKNVSNSDTGREQIAYIDEALIAGDERNFYELSNLEDLAANIELIGLQQPIRVRPDPDDVGGYLIVSGHRRMAAIRQYLKPEAPDRWAQIPCIIEDRPQESDAMRELRLIYANSDTRRMTSADISKQAERVEALLYQLKMEGLEFPGRMRDHVAEACKVSKSKLARLKVIREGLSPDKRIRKEWDDGNLPEATAYALAHLPADMQTEIVDKYLAEKENPKYGLKYLYENTVERIGEELQKLSQLKCKQGGGLCKDCATEKRGHIIAKKVSYSYSYIPCASVCCEKCDEFASCKHVCPKLKAKQEQRKVKEREKKKALKESQAAADAPLIDRTEHIWERFGTARAKAGIDPKKYISQIGISYFSLDEKDFEAYEHGYKIKPGIRLPFGYSFYLSDADTLVAAADALGVSLDYLFLRSDMPQLADEVAKGMPAGEPAPEIRWKPHSEEPPEGALILTRNLTNLGPVYRAAIRKGSVYVDPTNSAKELTGLQFNHWRLIPDGPEAVPSTAAQAASWISAETTPDHPCECVTEFDVGEGYTDLCLCKWDGSAWLWRGNGHPIDMAAIRWCEVPCAASPRPVAAVLDTTADASAWISVEDALPEPGVNVVTLDSDGDVDIDSIERDAGKFFYGNGSRYHVTHWMPLPEPPAKEGGD